ncbi:MAG: amidohydrolase [Hyphomonadaceae bacterium]|nr:amidohydrolase [Hyphomonadaceae bacterium]
MFTRRAFSGAVAAAGASACATMPGRASYRRISCEEGFLTPEILAQNARTQGRLIVAEGPTAGLARALSDIGAGRIEAMDAARIDQQVLVLSAPGVQVYPADIAVSLARSVNDRVSDACRAHPDRLAALATLAPQAPQSAARELERGVRELGLKGGLINSHTFGEYLDDQKFWPIFEAAEALDAPIYIHPRDPSPGLAAASPAFMGNDAWAYGIEVGTHAVRLIWSGVFDRFPELRFVIGHMGEAVPFWLPRLDNRYQAGVAIGSPRLQRMPSDYFLEHFVITTSGMNYWPQTRMTLDVMGRERVLFASDFPFEDQKGAVDLAEAFPMTPEEKALFFEANARRVFKV